jgi:hypothetical protein
MRSETQHCLRNCTFLSETLSETLCFWQQRLVKLIVFDKKNAVKLRILAVYRIFREEAEFCFVSEYTE